MSHERPPPASMLRLGHVIKEGGERTIVAENIISMMSPLSPNGLDLTIRNSNVSHRSSADDGAPVYLKEADEEMFDHGAEVTYRIAEKRPMDWLSNNNDKYARDVELTSFRTGIVTERWADTGCVYVECPKLKSKYGHNKLGSRAIILDEELSDFVAGDSVKFICQMTNDMAYARFLTRPPAPKDFENKRFRGEVKSYNNEKGFGFLASPEAKAIFGCDCFIHSKEISSFRIGDSVSFCVTVRKDRPQAYDLEQDIVGCLRYVGQLKSFSATSGYGFIGCPETFAVYGRDVFVHQNQTAGIVMGDHVEFGLTVKNGQPQAHDVKKVTVPARRSDELRAHSSSSPPRSSMDDSNTTTPRIEVKGAGTQGSEDANEEGDKSKRNLPDEKAKNYPQGILMKGILKSYNAEKGYGFISCKEMTKHFGKDVFVHSKHVQTFRVGDRLKFYVEIKNDSPQAFDVEADDTSDQRERFKGFIKSFTSSKGYGFIECPETKKLYGRDVFVHKDQMKSFCQGDWVTFMAQEKNNQPQAERLEAADPDNESDVEEIQPKVVPFRSVEKRLMRLCYSHSDTSRDMETLLVGQADPNFVDATGSTPLMSCSLNLSANACWQKIRTLLRFGASIDMIVGVHRDQRLIDWIELRIGKDFRDALVKLNDHISSSEDNPDILDELDINFCVSHPSEMD